jgi:hypothetical protein
MNCREARRTIVGRSLGPLAPELGSALRRHLERCRACAAEERIERCLKRELASLRGEFPHAIDIRRRVMRDISGLGSVEREVVPARQIGWAAAAAIACSLVLLGSLPWLWPQLPPLLADLKVMAATFGRVAVDLAAPLGTLLALPFKLAGVLFRSLAGFASLLSRLEPAAIGAIAICYMAMAATITLIVGRDLTQSRPALQDREE